MGSCLVSRWVQRNKRLPSFVRLPLKLVIGQPVRQLAALPRVKTVGSMIHFAMKGGKKKKSACERRNTPDHWEIIRWNGMVDVELNGIINQAKKQARCSYIYYLHVFHFKRCNKQIYVGAADLCYRHLEAGIPFLTTDPKSAKWDQICSAPFSLPHRLSSLHNALRLQSNLHNKQNKSHGITLFSARPLN